MPEDRDSSKFRKQRADHEAEEMPLHAWKSQPAASSLSPILYAAEEEAENGIFGITIQTPATEIDWKTIVKNPAKFAARSVQKGAEVEWRRLSEEQRRAMKEAKQLEVDQWIIRKVCAKADVQIPANRLMRMRWVLTFKAGDSADYVKAKARIVLLGYSDPDLTELVTAAPTLSRRGKMLLLNLATLGLPEGQCEVSISSRQLQSGQAEHFRRPCGGALRGYGTTTWTSGSLA